jgi:hypothetical protein
MPLVDPLPTEDDDQIVEIDATSGCTSPWR